jgi:hypothetical protein
MEINMQDPIEIRDAVIKHAFFSRLEQHGVTIESPEQADALWKAAAAIAPHVARNPPVSRDPLVKAAAAITEKFTQTSQAGIETLANNPAIIAAYNQ